VLLALVAALASTLILMLTRALSLGAAGKALLGSGLGGGAAALLPALETAATPTTPASTPAPPA